MSFDRKSSRGTFAHCLLLMALLVASRAFADSPHPDPQRDLRLEMEQLRQDYKALASELAAIKEILQGKRNRDPAMPVNLTLSTDGSPFKGNKDAKVTLIEFSDYECPFCANFFSDTLPRIEQDFISTGKLKYVRRDFPLVSIHQNAFKAAEAANCAGKQEKYWEMHGRLFANQNQLGMNHLPLHAKAIGLDMRLFEQCLKESEQAAVKRDVQEGLKAGVEGTPTIFFGVRDGDSQDIKVLRMIVGAQPYPAFKEAIESLLKQAE